jgi:hypothetical protein
MRSIEPLRKPLEAWNLSGDGMNVHAFARPTLTQVDSLQNNLGCGEDLCRVCGLIN